MKMPPRNTMRRRVSWRYASGCFYTYLNAHLVIFNMVIQAYVQMCFVKVKSLKIKNRSPFIHQPTLICSSISNFTVKSQLMEEKLWNQVKHEKTGINMTLGVRSGHLEALQGCFLLIRTISSNALRSVMFLLWSGSKLELLLPLLSLCQHHS